ncbi:MAG: EAL domain-containing protein [Methylotenera sp.]|uniref:sensor domain-containing phosphodiesterase n=1 Tax=Methylotenera sp. TaxID=2051956 RepID=UPI00248881B0|nr:EAL domain-containing protein [Methylotenera sp.]MDI1308987.1 EAL domain-containing protein [Methylotenera sp.]
MVRTYVITGDSIYKQHYQEILDIRNGKLPRPTSYNNIYWDLVLADNIRPRAYGENKPLLQRMKEAGFTNIEFAELSKAKSNSDLLTNREFAAMKLIEPTNATTALVRNKASLMLHDMAYHQAKAAIMQPISNFNQMMEIRTLANIHYAETTALVLRILVIFFGVMFSFALWRHYKLLNAILGASADEVHRHLVRIGSGELLSKIPVGKGMENSVMGWLSQTQIKLAQINNEHQAAELRSHRQTQLYAALSQCNQAIVRSKNERELFPKICQDAVLFGGMKMAWIGIFDEKSQLLIPVASYGTGTEYLDFLKISVDAKVNTGRGPSGTAFREDKPFWCLDFRHDPSTGFWHELGSKFEWGASAALPLHRNGKVVGIFNIYANDQNVFDKQGQNLLIEMTSDIDFALDNFDIENEREQFKGKLLESEEVSRLVLENSLDAIINMDSQGLVIEWSGAAYKMFGYQREDAMGQKLSDLIIPERDREAHLKGMKRVIATNQSNMTGRRVEVSALRLDGTEMPAEMSIAKIETGNLVFFSAFIRDITNRKEYEKQIQQLAHFDALTNLPNRILLQDHFKYALSLVKRNNGKLAIIFLDLDHFKDINDTLGHSIGDLLLKEVASRLQLTLREEDTLSRLGGDEFILILPGTDSLGAANVSQKLLNIMAMPYHIDSFELTVTGSLGVALYPDDGNDFEILSQKADTAMYRAKQEGRNNYRFFTAEMQAKSSRNLQLVNALRYALERNQLHLHYQPQISLNKNCIIGTEALLRWYHPDLGTISPAEFIPIAEDSGLIISIGEWVLRQAVKQAKLWMDEGNDPLIMAVNISAIQFRHPDLPKLVTQILEEIGLAPEYLELELTEGVAMYDPLGAIEMMNNLHELGIRLSIDDFGTGYSSLSYLKRFKVYKLKIDQSFVRDINTDPEDKAIVSAVISMSKSLGLQTIAEGVETIEQLTYLRAQGCDEVQGFYYSRAMPIEQLDKYFREFKSLKH